MSYDQKKSKSLPLRGVCVLGWYWLQPFVEDNDPCRCIWEHRSFLSAYAGRPAPVQKEWANKAQRSELGHKNLAKSTFPNCPEKVEVIESNLTVKIYRVRETASHIAFRGKEVNGGVKDYMVFKVQRAVLLARATSEQLISFWMAAPFSTV